MPQKSQKTKKVTKKVKVVATKKKISKSAGKLKNSTTLTSQIVKKVQKRDRRIWSQNRGKRGR